MAFSKNNSIPTKVEYELKKMNLLFPYASRPKSLRWEKIIYQIWGSMGNLAFIAATILNFGLALPVWKNWTKSITRKPF